MSESRLLHATLAVSPITAAAPAALPAVFVVPLAIPHVVPAVALALLQGLDTALVNVVLPLGDAYEDGGQQAVDDSSVAVSM